MEFARSDIRNIAFESISDRFSKGKYLGVEVTIDMTNGYINGPHLVGQVLTKGGEPKQFFNWRKTAEAKNLLEYLTLTIGRLDTIVDVTDVPVNLRGAYIHPRLVSHVAQWASPIFADKVAVILNDHAISEAVREKDKLITEHISTISKQTDTISELKQAIELQNDKIDELLGYARKTDEDLEQTRIELDLNAEESKIQIEGIHVELEIVQEKLGISVETRVPRDIVNRRNEVFSIHRKPNTLELKVIRCQVRSWSTAVKRDASLGYTERVYHKEDPNAVNIYNRVKTQLPPEIAKVISGYYIKLAPSSSVDQLIKFVESVENGKNITQFSLNGVWKNRFAFIFFCGFSHQLIVKIT